MYVLVAATATAVVAAATAVVAAAVVAAAVVKAAAVYIRARKYKAAVITQCNYLIHGKVCPYIFLLSAGLPKLLFAFSIITRPCLFFNLKKADMHTKWLFCVLYRRTALSARN